MLKRAFVLLAVVFVLCWSAPQPVAAMICYAGDESDGWCCETYPTSTITNFEGFGDACAYSGNGCTECFDTRYGDSCIAPGTYCSIHRPLNPR